MYSSMPMYNTEFDRAWTAMRPDLVDALDRTRLRWHAADLLGRSAEPTKEEILPSLLITAEGGELQDWTGAMDRVKRLCASHGIGGLRVEFVYGTVLRGTTCCDFSLSSYEEKPSNGSNIGVRSRVGKITEGTFGGYLKLSGSDEAVYALTCHHVVAPPEGIRPTRAVSMRGAKMETIHVFQPGHVQHEDEVDRVERVLAGAASPNAVAAATETLDTLESLDRVFGEVHLTSGVEDIAGPLDGENMPECKPQRGGYQDQMCLMDWGLLTVPAERVAGNYLPKLPNAPGSCLPPHPFGHVRDGMPATTVSELMGQLDVFKLGGKSTGTTYGTVLPYLSLVRLGDSDRATCEHGVLPNTHVNGSFSGEGDSGAWIADDNGYVVGMVWGSSRQTHITYVTPMTHILEHIGRISGERADLFVE